MQILTEDAKKISEIITNTDSDFRGNLFFEISENLKNMGQGYTSSLFLRIANDYGANPEEDP